MENIFAKPWNTPADKLRPQRITRNLVKQVGFLHLEDFHRFQDAMDAQQREDLLLQGLQGLKCLTISLVNFDGSTKTVADWLEDYDRFCTETKRESDADKLTTLISHLTGDVKQWFILQPLENRTDYTKLRPALLAKFSPTSQEKFSLKSKIYATKQQVNQTFKDYVRQQQLAARTAGLPQQELTSICISGALPTLKAHLAMAQPQTIEELLKLPLVVNEVVDEPLYTMMQTLTSRVDTMEANAKKQVKFQSRSPSPAAVNRSRSPSPPAQRRMPPGILRSTSQTPSRNGRQDRPYSETDRSRQWTDRSRQWTSRPDVTKMGLGQIVRDDGLVHLGTLMAMQTVRGWELVRDRTQCPGWQRPPIHLVVSVDLLIILTSFAQLFNSGVINAVVSIILNVCVEAALFSNSFRDNRPLRLSVNMVIL